jgi:ribosome-binding factor A
MSQRQERVARLIQSELAMLMREIKDPRVADAGGLLTITRVTVTADLGLARIGVVLHGEGPEKQKALIAGLTRAAPFLRNELRKRIEAKKTPELRFEIDEGVEASGKVDEILKDLAAEKASRGDE